MTLQSTKSTITRLHRAAALGSANAQYRLALAYHRGESVPKDDHVAVGWWHKAAEQGHFLAQRRLYWMYSRGEGVPRDLRESNKWKQKADQQECARGRHFAKIQQSGIIASQAGKDW